MESISPDYLNNSCNKGIYNFFLRYGSFDGETNGLKFLFQMDSGGISEE